MLKERSRRKLPFSGGTATVVMMTLLLVTSTPTTEWQGLRSQIFLYKVHSSGLAAGQPFIETDVGNSTQTNFEVFYNFPMNQNIQITPLLQVITNPANQDSNGTIVTGTLRTVLSF